jgi:hypothetical protein
MHDQFEALLVILRLSSPDHTLFIGCGEFVAPKGSGGLGGKANRRV